MLAFFGRRLLIAIQTIILIPIFVFTLQMLRWGDPGPVLAGEKRNPEVLGFNLLGHGLRDALDPPDH